MKNNNDFDPMRAAFLRALVQRCVERGNGLVVLPTGRAKLEEVARVLHAIDRCNKEDST